MAPKEDASTEETESMREEYREEEAEVAQKRFTKFVSLVALAHLLGLLSCVGVWQQYPGSEEIQNILLSSAMIFGIGLATAAGSYVIFLTSIAMSREAVRMRQQAGDDEMGLALAREMQADAVARAKNGFKPLNFSGVCFVASSLIGISGLLSV